MNVNIARLDAASEYERLTFAAAISSPMEASFPVIRETPRHRSDCQPQHETAFYVDAPSHQ